MAYRMMLAVNFTPERLSLLKLLGLLTKSQIKVVAEEEKTETVGKLLGLSDDEIAEIAANKVETSETKVHEDMGEDEALEPVTKEALILCGFDNKAVNLLLDGIRRGRLKSVPLKAMVTPNNISWTIDTILQVPGLSIRFCRNWLKSTPISIKNDERYDAVLSCRRERENPAGTKKTRLRRIEMEWLRWENRAGRDLSPVRRP